MKFNLGEKVRIKSNGIIGIIIARGYNEYLDENDKQQSFEEYQIEADKYYQCNEDEIELCNPIIEEGKYLTKDIIDCKMFEELTGLLKPQEIKNVKVEDEKNCKDCDYFVKSSLGNYCDFYGILLNIIHGCNELQLKKHKEGIKDIKTKTIENDLVNPFMEVYERMVTDTMELCKKKNKDYGSSVQNTFEKFGDVSYLVRITDKYNRICSLLENGKSEVRDESITDTIVDLANYCFLWASSRNLQEGK